MKAETYFKLIPKILEAVEVALPAMRRACENPRARYIEVCLDIDMVMDTMTCDTKTGELWATISMAKSGIVFDECLPNTSVWCDDVEFVKIPLPSFLISNTEISNDDESLNGK